MPSKISPPIGGYLRSPTPQSSHLRVLEGGLGARDRGGVLNYDDTVENISAHRGISSISDTAAVASAGARKRPRCSRSGRRSKLRCRRRYLRPSGDIFDLRHRSRCCCGCSKAASVLAIGAAFYFTTMPSKISRPSADIFDLRQRSRRC